MGSIKILIHPFLTTDDLALTPYDLPPPLSDEMHYSETDQECKNQSESDTDTETDSVNSSSSSSSSEFDPDSSGSESESSTDSESCECEISLDSESEEEEEEEEAAHDIASIMRYRPLHRNNRAAHRHYPIIRVVFKIVPKLTTPRRFHRSTPQKNKKKITQKK